MKQYVTILFILISLFSCSTKTNKVKYKLITTKQTKHYPSGWDEKIDTTIIEAATDSAAYDNAYANFMISCAVNQMSDPTNELTAKSISFICLNADYKDVKTLLKQTTIVNIEKDVNNFDEVKKYLQQISDTSLYELMNTEHYKLVTNYYIYYKKTNFTKAELSRFILKFRSSFVNGKANVYLYDSKEIKKFMSSNSYPEGSDYLKVADHFIAESEFETPNDIYFFSLQETKYKELGGKNFRKDKLE